MACVDLFNRALLHSDAALGHSFVFRFIGSARLDRDGPSSWSAKPQKSVASEAACTAALEDSLQRLAHVHEAKDNADPLIIVVQKLKQDPDALRNVKHGLDANVFTKKAIVALSFSPGYVYLFKIPSKQMENASLAKCDPRLGQGSVRALLKGADKQWSHKALCKGLVCSGKDKFGPHIVDEWDALMLARHVEVGENLKFLTWGDDGKNDWPAQGHFGLQPDAPEGAALGTHVYTEIILRWGGISIEVFHRILGMFNHGVFVVKSFACT